MNNDPLPPPFTQEQAQQMMQQMQQQMQQMQQQQQQINNLQHMLQQAALASQAPAPPAAAPVPYFCTFKIPTPDSFNGLSTKQTVDNWLMSLQLYFEAVRNQDPTSQAEVAATLLRDSALQWWISVRNSRQQQPHPTFPEFQALIRQRFSSIDQEKIARTQFFQLRQRSLSVQEYCFRFQELCNTLSFQQDDVIPLHVFVAGLRPDIALHVEISKPTTVQAAMSMAHIVEETNRQLQFRRGYHQRSGTQK